MDIESPPWGNKWQNVMRLWHSLTDFSGDNNCSLSTYLCIIVAYFCIHFQSLKGGKINTGAVSHCSIDCSHAIFMIMAILLNSSNFHHIKNKLQSRMYALHVNMSNRSGVLLIPKVIVLCWFNVLALRFETIALEICLFRGQKCHSCW